MSTAIKVRLSVMMFLEFFIWGAWFVTMGSYLTGSLGFSGADSALAYSTQSWGAIIAPFVIGLVLGRISEESLHKALGLWGLSFFTRPLSLVLIGIIVATVGFAVYRNVRASFPQQLRTSP